MLFINNALSMYYYYKVRINPYNISTPDLTIYQENLYFRPAFFLLS
jgi:hypothetical protein